METELILIDKPSGISSFDVIRRLRTILGRVKMGHAGTLDPLASGLMLIGVGSGTKKLSEYVGLDKEYVAAVRLGVGTDTGDVEGKVLEERAIQSCNEDALDAALGNLVGILTLPVPRYAAVKQGGVALYKRARKGEAFTPPKREMRVYAAELIDCTCAADVCDATVRFHVASGVYIRSLAEALGRKLGYPATLAALRRTKVGRFDISDARTLDALAKELRN